MLFQLVLTKLVDEILRLRCQDNSQWRHLLWSFFSHMDYAARKKKQYSVIQETTSDTLL